MRRTPAGQLTERGAPLRAAAQPASAEITTRALALGTAVRRVAKYGVIRPACLVRAIALRRLLEADGIQGAVIRVGVKQAESGMDAHAWVEFNGVVLGDSEDNVRQYAPLDELSVSP